MPVLEVAQIWLDLIRCHKLVSNFIENCSCKVSNYAMIDKLGRRVLFFWMLKMHIFTKIL